MEPLLLTLDCNPSEFVALKQRTQSQSELYGHQYVYASTVIEDFFLSNPGHTLNQSLSGMYRCTLTFNLQVKRAEEKKQRKLLIGKYQSKKPDLAKLCGFMLNFIQLELDNYNAYIVDTKACKLYASRPSIICLLEKIV